MGQPDERRREDDRKFRRTNFGTLEIELTTDDPKVYTKVFIVNLTQNLEADTELLTSSASKANKTTNDCSARAGSNGRDP